MLGLTGCPPESNPRAPQAAFSATPREGLLPLTVQFNDTSLPGTSQIRVWYWEFGDGTSSREASPRHEYTAPGTYTVRLTVESAEGTDVAEREDYIEVIQRNAFASIGAAGGRVGLGGASIEIPAGAFSQPVSVGVIYEQEPFVASFPEAITTLSPGFSIAHNRPVTGIFSTDPATGEVTPGRIEMTFRPDLVPAGDRNGRKIHLLATLPSGDSIPIFGSVQGNRIVAPVTGLPPRATYGVVYRPEVEQFRVTVDPGARKAATNPAWLRDWALYLSPHLARELTALRLGTLTNPEPYGRLDFTTAEIEQTSVMLAAAIGRIAAAYEAAGLRSPVLAEVDGAYPVPFYRFVSGYNPDFVDYSALLPYTTVFGSLAIDPAQLLNVTRHNAARVLEEANLNQEFDFDKVFGQAAYEAAYLGYGLPGITRNNAPQNESDVPFDDALRQGAGLYFGQLQGGLPIARAFSLNEVASLSEPLFAPFSAELPGYAKSGQDFLFFLDNATGAGLFEVFMTTEPTQLGLLERLRIALDGQDTRTFDQVTRTMIETLDETFVDFLGASLGELYWDFARARGVDMQGAGLLRPADATRMPFTLQRDLFRSQSVIDTAFTGTSTEIMIGGDRAPALNNVPPLTSRAIVVDIDPATPGLTFTFNRDEWQADARGNSVGVKVYGEGNDGFELPEGESTVVINPSGKTASGFGAGPFGKQEANVVVLISNLNMSAANSIYMNATRPAPVTE
jgi:PKD repeat protein